MTLRTELERRPLAVTAILVAAIKACQFTADRTPLFFNDSGAFIENALGVGFVSFRSYFYGWLIRLVAVAARSLTALVAMQVVMGGVTGWLVAVTLRRHFSVRPWIALVAAVVFAFDPMQVVHERMVMTETAALLALVALLLVALEYLRSRQLRWLVAAAVAGITLVGLRIAYLPATLATAVVLPIAPYVTEVWCGGRVQFRRPATIALVVSCAATFACHTAYRQLTGHLAHTGPVYHDWTGLFEVATIAPLLKPQDTDVPWVAALVTAQESSALPLSRAGLRAAHLWEPGGFVSRLRDGFGGDNRAAEREAGRMFRRAVLRDPLGFARLAALTYLRYWYHLGELDGRLRRESGIRIPPPVIPFDEVLVAEAFRFDTRGQHELESPARRYYAWGRWWCLILLAVPFLWLAAIFRVAPDQRVAAAWLALWSWMVIIEISFGAVDTVYRYLHPLSFTGAVAAGLLLEAALRSRASALCHRTFNARS